MRIALDADPLIQSLGGGMARKIILESELEFVTTAFTIKEAKSKCHKIAKRTHFPEILLKMMIESVPALVYEKKVYGASLQEARKQIGARDPNDVEILALCLHFKIPIWTSDKDFEICKIKTYTTKDLLKYLGWI